MFLPTLASKKARPTYERKGAPFHSEKQFMTQESPTPKPGIFLFTESQSNTRRNQEFVNHLKMKLLYKHLDEIIIEFLFQQYIELNLNREGSTDDLSDDNFKMKFVKNNRRLINLLRERLCKNKQFLSSLFTKTFMNVVMEENHHQAYLDAQTNNSRIVSFDTQIQASNTFKSQFPSHTNHFSLDNTSIKSKVSTPKKVTIGIKDPSVQDKIVKKELSQPLKQEDTLIHDFKPEKLPDLATSGQNTLSIQETINNTTTASITRSKFLKLNPLNKTLSSFSLKKGVSSKLEVRLSTEPNITQKSNSQYKSYQDLKIINQTFSDKQIKPFHYPDFLNKNIKYRNPPRTGTKYSTIGSDNKPQSPSNFPRNELAHFPVEISEKAKKDYLYYVNLMGEPSKLNHYGVLNKVNPPNSVHSYSLMLMASRMGLKITNQNSDLVLIPYLMLSLQLPIEFERRMTTAYPEERVYIQKLWELKVGAHPADHYLHKLLEHYLQMRTKILGALSEENKRRYIWSHSWMKFSQSSGNHFHFNMFTKEKSDFLPTEAKNLLLKMSLLINKYQSVELLKEQALEGLNAEINQIYAKEKESAQRAKELKAVISPISNNRNDLKQFKFSEIQIKT